MTKGGRQGPSWIRASSVSQVRKDRTPHEGLLGTEEKEGGWQGEQGRLWQRQRRRQRRQGQKAKAVAGEQKVKQHQGRTASIAGGVGNLDTTHAITGVSRQ